MNEGWICPRCSKVHAPDVKACSCKRNDFEPERTKYIPYPTYPPNTPDYGPHWWDWYTIV